jgi:hypothetical protein
MRLGARAQSGYILDDKILPIGATYSHASSKPASTGSAHAKRAASEAVTSLHDLSAVDLIEGFRASQFSPLEVLEDVLAHVAVWEPHIKKALYAFDRTAPARLRKRRPNAGKGEPQACSTASPSPSRTISLPRACRCRWAPPAMPLSRRAGCAARRARCAKRVL